jgi:hypothetical protein
LGSIPRNTEKVLIEEKNKTSLGFSTRSDRFGIRSQSVKYNFPGPGSYKLEKNFDFTVSNNSLYSSKGFGNGFVAGSERFNNSNEFYEKFYPGPGQYKTDETLSLSSVISKSLTYKSLYEKPGVKSLKKKIDIPGPGFYNPILLKSNGFKGPLSIFQSTVKRFKKDNKDNFPASGNYFQDNDYLKHKFDKNNMNNPKSHTMNYFFKLPSPKKENVLEKYLDIKKDIKTDAMNYTEREKENPMSKIYTHSKAYLSMAEIITKEHLEKADNSSTTNMLDNKNFGLNMMKTTTSVRDLIDINAVLGRNKKESIFKLSSPRWANANKAKHVPGPAFYNPQVSPKKINHHVNNEKIWI